MKQSIHCQECYDEQMPDHTRVRDAVVGFFTRCDLAGIRLWTRVCQDVSLANDLAVHADVIYRMVLSTHEYYADHPFHDEASAIQAANDMYDGVHHQYNSQVDKRCWLQFVCEAEYRPFDDVFNIQLAKRCFQDGRRFAGFGDATANTSIEQWIARNKALDFIAQSIDSNGVPQAIVVVNAYGYMSRNGAGTIHVTDHPVSTAGEYDWFGNWMQDRYKHTSSQPYVVYAESSYSDSKARGDADIADMEGCHRLDAQFPWLLARLRYTAGRSWGHTEYQINAEIPNIEKAVRKWSGLS